MTTVTRTLHSRAHDAPAPSSGPTSRHSSWRSDELFHPQLWLTANTSGPLVKRVSAVPVVLGHATVKYAATDPRGSRYGAAGATGGAVAGRPPVLLLGEDEWYGEVPVVGEPGMGVFEREFGSMGRPEKEYWIADVTGEEAVAIDPARARTGVRSGAGRPKGADGDGSGSTVDWR